MTIGKTHSTLQLRRPIDRLNHENLPFAFWWWNLVRTYNKFWRSFHQPIYARSDFRADLSCRHGQFLHFLVEQPFPIGLIPTVQNFLKLGSYFFLEILLIQTFQFSVFFSERWSQLLTTRQFSFRKSEITSDSYIFVSLWETEIQLFLIISVSNKLVLHHQSSPDHHSSRVNADGVFCIIYIMTV